MLKEQHREVGNLVRLTSYGTKMKSNPPFMTGTKGHLLLGVITRLDPSERYPIRVRWFHKHATSDNIHGFRELKFVRGGK